MIKVITGEESKIFVNDFVVDYFKEVYEDVTLTKKKVRDYLSTSERVIVYTNGKELLGFLSFRRMDNINSKFIFVSDCASNGQLGFSKMFTKLKEIALSEDVDKLFSFTDNERLIVSLKKRYNVININNYFYLDL